MSFENGCKRASLQGPNFLLDYLDFFLPPEDRDVFVEGRIWLYVDKFILNYSTQMGIGALNNNIWPLFIGI